MTAKISVIVPIYNADKYLARCIDSIVNHTYHNLEIILVDDGSVDQSLKICEQYAKNDTRIKIIYQHNQGVSVARNNGISHATGEYICFVDADDFVSKDYCQNLVNLIKRDNSDIAVYTYIFYINHRYFVNLAFTAENMIKDGCYSAKKWLRTCLIDFDIFLAASACGKLFKRSLFKHIRFPVNVDSAEDTYTTWRIYLTANRISFVNQSIYTYCRHSDSTISTHKPIYTEWPLLCQQISLLHIINMNTEFLKPKFADKLSVLKDNAQQDNKVHLLKNTEILKHIVERYQR